MTQKTMENNVYLKEYMKYISLNVMGMVAISCYILADTFFISKGIGSVGLTALNLALPFFSIIRGCGLMLGMGGGTRYSVLTAQDNREEACRNFTVTIRNTFIVAALFFLAGLLFSGQLARLMGADDEIFDMTYTYLKTLLMFAPLFIFNDVMICFVRNDGAPHLAMIGMITGSVVNIILDYIFIFPLDMGIFGAVLATGISPGVGLLISLTHLFEKKSSLYFVRKQHEREHITRMTLAIGCPSLVNEISTGIVILVFNLIILELQGNTGVAAYGIIANISYVIISIFTGIAEGLQPLTSREYGYENGVNIRRFYRYGIVSVIIVSVIIYAVAFIFTDTIVDIFNSENNVRLAELAVPGMRIYFAGIFFAGFNMVTAIFFTSIQRPVQAQIVSMMRGLIVIVPAAFILSRIFGITGVWLAFPVSEFIVMMTGAAVYHMLGKRNVY